jgi:hypothetical protein
VLGVLLFSMLTSSAPNDSPPPPRGANPVADSVSDDCVVILEGMTVTGAEVYESCSTLLAGPSIVVDGPAGDLLLRAPNSIVLRNGVTVGQGAALTVALDPALAPTATPTPWPTSTPTRTPTITPRPTWTPTPTRTPTITPTPYPAGPRCQQFSRNLLPVTVCEAMPDYDKYFIPRTFTRGGKDYLILNFGNELQLWNVTDPANPVKGSVSRFRITNLGDSDYDLVNYSVCDDCRYGIANFKLATVLFDLGTASAPTLSIDREYDPLVASRFGFTFSYGGVQYVLSDDLEDGYGEPIHCASGGTPLIRMDGIAPGDLTKVGCVEDGAGGPFDVANGHQVTGTPFVYIGGQWGGAFVYELMAGPSPELVRRATLSSTASVKNKGLEIDPVSGYAALADGNSIAVWDIFPDPGDPSLVGSYDTGALVSTVAIRYPFVFSARRLSFESEHLFLIEDFLTGGPAPIDPAFWQVPNAQNPVSDCEKIMGGTFSTDGTHLYTGGWTASKMFNLTGCADPPP